MTLNKWHFVAVVVLEVVLHFGHGEGFWSQALKADLSPSFSCVISGSMTSAAWSFGFLISKMRFCMRFCFEGYVRSFRQCTKHGSWNLEGNDDGSNDRDGWVRS